MVRKSLEVESVKSDLGLQLFILKCLERRHLLSNVRVTMLHVAGEVEDRKQSRAPDQPSISIVLVSQQRILQRSPPSPPRVTQPPHLPPVAGMTNLWPPPHRTHPSISHRTGTAVAAARLQGGRAERELQVTFISLSLLTHLLHEESPTSLHRTATS